MLDAIEVERAVWTDVDGGDLTSGQFITVLGQKDDDGASNRRTVVVNDSAADARALQADRDREIARSRYDYVERHGIVPVVCRRHTDGPGRDARATLCIL